MNEFSDGVLTQTAYQLVAMLLAAGYLGYEISRSRNDTKETETISKTIEYLILNGYVRGYTDKDGVEHMLKINQKEPK